MISVCLATFNGAAFIEAQLASILSQLAECDEVIVSDDGSTDGTLEAVKAIGDRRIRIIQGPRKGSPTLNFEHALRAAKGDYIFLSDQDDVWKGHKVATIVPLLRSYGCVVTDAELTDDQLNPLLPSFFRWHGTRPGRLFNLLIKNGYMGCTMAFTRQVLASALPFPPHTPMHDLWIGNVAAFTTGVKWVDEPLISYRCHAGNASFTARGKSQYSLIEKLQIRLRVTFNLIKQLS